MTCKFSVSRIASRPGRVLLGVLLSALASTTLLTGCASMSDAPAPQNKSARSANANELFEALDTNHDGVITREEMTRALESLGEEGRMQAVQMVYGLRARKPTPTEKLKHLSAAERKKLIASAFKNKNTKSAEADQERISQDDFRKIVLGPDVTEASEQTSVDSSDTLNNREPAQANPWNKFL